MPQTAPGVALLDDFNAGATQLLTAPRKGWSPTGVWNSGDLSWRTDAVPTVADCTLTPASPHSNIWNDKFNVDQEAWLTIGGAGGAGSDVYLVINSDANNSVGGNTYAMVWANGGLLQLLTGPTLVGTNIGAAAAGDSMAVQRDGAYLFGWFKRAAGAWTLALSMVHDNARGDGWIGFFQTATGTSTVTAFGGGSFYTHSPHNTSNFRRTWAGRS